MQDTFVLAYRNLKSLKDNTRFQSWVFRIAQSNIYQKYRKRPPETESVEAEGTREIADREGPTGSLVRQKQLGVARKVVGSPFSVVSFKPLKTSLYKEMGDISKIEGKDQEVLELFKKAIELDESLGSPAEELGASPER